MSKAFTILVFIVLAGLVVYLAPSVFNFVSANLANSNFNGGVFYYSLDGGDSFIKNSRGLNFCEINNLIFSPDSKTIFAATNQGLFQNTDLKEGWERINDESGILKMSTKVMAMTFLDNNPEKVLVAVYKSSRGKIYQSTDDLKNLKEVYTVNNEKAEISDVKFDEVSKNVYFVSSEGIFGYSNDAGSSFRFLKQFPYSLKKIVISPLNNQTIFLLTRQNIYKTLDAGHSFIDLREGLNSQGIQEINDLFINKAGILFLASQKGAWRSFDGGFSWQKMDSLLPQTLPSGAIAYNNERGEVLIGFDGRFYRSADTLTWTVRTLNQSNFINVIGIHPLDSKIILVGLKRQ